MKYTVTITIRLKEGMLNPEARAIQHALKNLGYAAAARETARQMCDRLLANPVIHDYAIEVE